MHASHTSVPWSAVCVILRSIQHHGDYTIDMPVRRGQSADIHAQPPGKRGANRVRVEFLALDLAGLEYIVGEHLQGRLIAQADAEVVHTPEQTPLRVVNLCQ